jgi:D-arabinose 5-phosphate isomerase GutQ
MTIFISYVSEDHSEAKALARALNEKGVETWLDKERLRGGEVWREEIETAIGEAVLFAVLISNISNKKNETHYYKEIRKALDRQLGFSSKIKFIVPVRINETIPLDKNLMALQWVEINRQDQDAIEHAAQELYEIYRDSPLLRSNETGDEIEETFLEIIRQTPPEKRSPKSATLTGQICQRVKCISDSITKTAESNRDVIDETVDLFSEWMLNGAVVRVIGAGRARLAGAIPANRMSHGGARVYVQDDMIPMPHTIKQGGVIAVSASGRSASVLQVLRDVKSRNPAIKIVGIADKSAKEFRELCHLFIGIESSDLDNPLEALADSNEYVCSMLLDAIVVAAGNRSGFDDTTWRLGHENLGATGPYDIGDR